MFGIGFSELMIILVIVLIFFGVGKLPQIGEGLGKAMRGFKKGVSEADEIDVAPEKKDDTQKKEGPGKSA